MKQLKMEDATITENGYGPARDFNNNSADFFIQAEPNPQNSGAEAVPPVPELPGIILLAFGLLMLAGLLTKGGR